MSKDLIKLYIYLLSGYKTGTLGIYNDTYVVNIFETNYKDYSRFIATSYLRPRE